MIKGKKLLFITDSCPPDLTMSGIVVKNIVDSLLPYNSVDIIALRQGKDDVEYYKGIKVKYINSFPYYILHYRKKGKDTDNEALRIWYRFVEFLFRLVSITARVISPIGINVFTTYKINAAIEKKIHKTTYDYILCNAKPFESFEAVLKIIAKRTYPDTKFIAYQTDDFVTSKDERFIPRIGIRIRSINRSKRINDYVKLFDVYGILESVYLKEIKYISEPSKIKSMGIPLLIKKANKKTNTIRNRKDIRIVYAGSLNKSFRPPNACLNVLTELVKKGDFKVFFFHRGDCDDIISSYEKKSAGVIRNMGSVNTEDAYKEIESADVLISISNIDGDQISGKTFEYISTCKPVIHFCYSESDVNAAVFKRYTNGLCCVCTDDSSVPKNVSAIFDFILNNRLSVISFEEIIAEFGAYTVDKVVCDLFEE